MPIVNRIGDFHEEMKGWRRHLHAHPELMFDCHGTAAYVVERLREFGITQIETGIATSGVVAVIEGRGDGPTIGLRADMDALPMTEVTGLPHASTVEGKMHACGHDGHTTMLLGAAKYLAETRNFSGRVALIFQPAEEGGGGANVMVQDGVLDRHDISQVYALHNLPGLPVGEFRTTPGPIMAAVDTLDIKITGKGAHAAYPHEGVDPVICAAAMAQSLQSIVSRNIDPMDQVVLSVTQIHSGTVHNVIPDTASLQATLRTFKLETRDMVIGRIAEIVNGTAAAYGVTAEHKLWDGYPATVNDPNSTFFAAKVAAEIAGEDRVSTDAVPSMGAEDFSFMLNQRPGAYLFVGNGDTAMLHNTSYDFDDDVSVSGASFFARVVETAQPV
ncbi:MAG: M20 aminoacylase family protein [Pseudomonadota bacterium]